jgi:hypothetical protein
LLLVEEQGSVLAQPAGLRRAQQLHRVPGRHLKGDFRAEFFLGRATAESF